MKTVEVVLRSISPYSQSRHYNVPKLEKEGPGDYEARTWRERCHVDASDELYIPPMALKNCLSDAAKFLSIQIPGKGKSTYTKHFEAGILVMNSIPLGIKKKDVEGEWLFVPADGKRGSGRRVEKCFPFVRSWEAAATVHIADETITLPVLEHHLSQAGMFIGMGRFRPRNNGFYGRFEVVKFDGRAAKK